MNSLIHQLRQSHLSQVNNKLQPVIKVMSSEQWRPIGETHLELTNMFWLGIVRAQIDNIRHQIKLLLVLLLVLLLGLLLSPIATAEIAWKSISITNDVPKGWTNDHLFLHAVAPSNHLGQLIILEGKINMADTKWLEIVTTNYIDGMQIDFRNVPFHFFRSRVVQP